MRGKRRGRGGVAGEVKAWGSVVRRVGDVEGVCTERTVEVEVS